MKRTHRLKSKGISSYHRAAIRLVLPLILLACCSPAYPQARPESYLNDIKNELRKEWPHNRTINLVFHGHSVPAGYFETPEVRTFDSYPFLLLKELKAIYPNAVINVIITSIGGENSLQGEARFEEDVLVHKPDVLFIDYALNDRNIGLSKSKEAMEKMIRKALQENIKIILLTPSPDMRVKLSDPDNELGRFAAQIAGLAAKHGTGLVNSYQLFRKLLAEGADLHTYMSQVNHPNKEGHQIIAEGIESYF